MEINVEITPNGRLITFGRVEVELRKEDSDKLKKLLIETLEKI
ncbi:MAG: hypothetical protein ACXQS7_05245 [Candidatus Syntropharchaeia archaeon]